jgi:hypothetical protein
MGSRRRSSTSGRPPRRRLISRSASLVRPALSSAWAIRGTAWYQGQPEEAVAALEEAVSRSREAVPCAYLGHMYGRLGRRDEAGCLLQELDQFRVQGHAPPIAFAVIHAGLGDLDAGHKAS